MTVLTTRHPILETLSDDLLTSGKWQRWRESDPRLAAHTSLDDALQAWRRDPSGVAYLTIAALASVGSSRGGNDDAAAMAVVLLLQDGILRLATDLRDQCELDDVMAAVWEEVKRSAPNLGHRAPRFLIQRAKARLLDPARGFVDRNGCVALESIDLDGQPQGTRLACVTIAPVDEACEDLGDLLEWARGAGVLGQDDVDLVLELMTLSRAAVGREDAYRVLGERHGVAMRTMRRRRDAVVDRLRGAAHEYLSEIA